ncbi:MAG: MBG domain-containing protein, partial [Pseudomonadota bacterium]
MLKALIKSLGNKPLNPRILDHFLPTNWEKNQKEKLMTPERTTVTTFMSFLIRLTGFPIAFCIRRFERPARVTSLMTARGNHVSTLWRQIALIAAIACVFTVGQAQANGTDPTVVEGQASFSTQGSTLSITNSPGAIIHWQGFSIDANEITRFIQQSAASSVLNRVIGSDPSVILGTLTSNGRVFLINPSGILVGQGARIDVAGLVASTLNLSNQDFLAGRLNFASNPFAGTVENQGSITTPSGGSVYLVGSNVSNSGIINSPQGDVILAAGQSVKIFDTSTPGVRVELTASDNAAVNLGEILAQSGEVGIYGALLRNTGIINADQVVRDASGKIVLRAKQDVTLEAGSLLSASGDQGGEITVQSETGDTLVSGTIDASGIGAGQIGGTVQVLGDKVGLFGGHINASGDAGGGTVLVGGDYQGKNPSVQNASATYMSADSTINADAITSGNGGKVIVWSDGSTRAYGSFTAQGGSQSGDGGLIETSGHYLDVAGAGIDAGAPHGAAGTWLLDPFNVWITAASSAGGFSSSGGTDTWTPDATASTVSNTVISNLLETTNVTIQTDGGEGVEDGTITVSAPITRAAGGPAAATLTLTSHPDKGTIVISASGSISGSSGNPLNVNLNAVGSTSGGTVSVSAPITTFGGTFLSTGTAFSSPAGGTIDTSGGAGGTLTIDHTGFITISDNLKSSGGNISITGSDLSLVTPKTVDSGSGNVTLKPKIASSIGVGTGGGTFSVSDDELSRVNSTGTITIGDRTLASAIVAGGITAGTKNLRLSTAGTIEDVVTTAVTLTTGTLTLDAASTIGAATPFNVGVTKLVVKTEASFDITNAGMLTDLSVTTNGAAGSQNLVSTGLTYTVAEDGINTTINAVTSTGALNHLFYQNTVGNITVAASGITTNGTGDAVVLAGNRFINSVGASAITTPNGRWLVYSTQPADDIFGGLASGNLALWGKTYGTYPPTNVTELGKRYLFANQPALTVTADAKTKMYGDAVALTSTVTGLVNAATYGGVFIQDTYSGTPSLLSPGTALTAGVSGSPYTIAAASGTFTAPTGYGATVYTDALLTIDRATYTVLSDSKTYDGNANFSDVALTGVNGESFNVATATSDFANASANTVNPAMTFVSTGDITGISGDTGNYNALVLGSLTTNSATIDPLAITLLATTASKTYGNADPALAASVSVGTLASGDTLAEVTGTVGRQAGETVASSPYDITLGSGAKAGNYDITFVAENNAFTIGQRALTAVGLTSTVTKVYDGFNTISNLTPGNYSITGFVAGEGATIGLATGTYDTGKNVQGPGSAVTSAVLAAGNYTQNAGTLLSNYDLSAVVGVTAKGNIGAITPAALTLNGTRVYDATTVFAGDNLIASGIAGETFTVTGAGDITNLASKHVQTGSIMASVTGLALGTSGDGGLASNYKAITTAGSSVDVTERPITLTAPSVTKTYDGLLTYATTAGDLNSITLSGPLVGEDAVTAATIAYTNKNAGTGNKAVNLDAATIDDGNSGLNYTVTLAGNTTSTINPAALTVAADPQSKVYGTSDPALTYSASGFQFSDTAGTVLFGALKRATGDPAICECITCLNGETVPGGPYAITQGTLAANSNYTLGSFTGNDLTITPAALNVAANAQSKLFGTSDPALTFSVTGLVNNPALGIADTADSVLSGALTRVPGESALDGPYAITQGTLTAKCNYTLGFTHNNLNIIGAAAEPVLGFNAGQVIFAGVINNEFYYRPG